METTTKDIGKKVTPRTNAPGKRSPQSPSKDSARVSRYGDPSKRRGGGDKRGGGKKPGGKRFGKRGERQKPEFDQKIVSIRRVTRVVAGGRRFSFSVSMVVGDKKGAVGVGVGKASDTALAIDKALRDAKNTMVTIKRTKEGSVPHDVEAKYTSSHVLIKPSQGKGLVAGSSVRTVLELAGIKDVSAKLLSRSKNKLNNAKAAVKALEKFGTISTRQESSQVSDSTEAKSSERNEKKSS